MSRKTIAPSLPYVRGEAFIAAHRYPEAAAEFQKILDHRGLVGLDPVGATARLQLARALFASGDRTRSAAVYKDFLTLWKDADPDIPILKQAKASTRSYSSFAVISG